PLLGSSGAFAAGPHQCNPFSTPAANAFSGVHSHPKCGLCPNDPKGGFNATEPYARVFRGAKHETIYHFSPQIRDAINRCLTCQSRALISAQHRIKKPANSVAET